MRSENSPSRKQDPNGRSSRPTAKFSIVFVATGNDLQIFPSVDSLPKQLRHTLEASTNGPNSATILIADKRGREELVRALDAHAPQTGLIPSALRAAHRASQPFSWRTWAELLLPIGLGASLWLYFASRF